MTRPIVRGAHLMIVIAAAAAAVPSCALATGTSGRTDSAADIATVRQYVAAGALPQGVQKPVTTPERLASEMEQAISTAGVTVIAVSTSAESVRVEIGGNVGDLRTAVAAVADAGHVPVASARLTNQGGVLVALVRSEARP